MTDPASPLPSIPYDQEGFYQILAEVQGRLAELRYIDRAIEYLGREQAETKWYHHLPGRSFTMEVPLGETVPFTRSFTIANPDLTLPWEYSPLEEVSQQRMDEVNRRLGELKEEARTWATDDIETVRSRVEPITYPSTARYDTDVLAPLYDAQVMLEDEVSNDFGKLRATIGHWEGAAAESFQTHFYNPFEDTLRSHEKLIAALSDGMVVAKDILVAAQHSLMNVVHYTSQRLYRQLELRSLDSSEDSAATVLVIAAAAASLLGAVLSRGGRGSLWPVGLEAASGATDVAGTALLEQGNETFPLLGATADQILESLADAIAATEENMVTQYEGLWGKVDDVRQRVTELRDGGSGDDGRLVPIRPALMDGVDAESFRLPDVG